MSLVNITFAISAPAKRAWDNLKNHRQFDHIAELFFDALQHERYRCFAVRPDFFTEVHGHRKARRDSLRAPGEKLHKTKLIVQLKTLQRMKRLENLGLSLSWQVEEILYFGFSHGMLHPRTHAHKVLITGNGAQP